MNSLTPSQLEYIHLSIDSVEVKYKNRNYFQASLGASNSSEEHQRFSALSDKIEGIREDKAPLKIMTNYSKYDTSSNQLTTDAQPSGWVKLGVIATASALAGGLAAAWWYRKTLKKFHQAEENPSNPQFGIPEDDPADDG